MDKETLKDKIILLSLGTLVGLFTFLFGIYMSTYAKADRVLRIEMVTEQIGSNIKDIKKDVKEIKERIEVQYGNR